MNDIKDEVVKVYDQTGATVETLVANLKARNENNDDEVKQSVGKLLGKMDEQKREFNRQIAELESDSEFEKFTIAFFGQTNAGKSTIIEALRILFEEEERKKRIHGNILKQKRLREDEVALCSEVLTRLEGLKKAYRPVPFSRKLMVPLLLFVIGLICGGFLAWRFL